MSQGELGTLVAAETSGTDLAARLRTWRDSIHTSHSGSARPSYAQPGLIWLDTSGETWVRKLWTGLVDVSLDSINPTTGAIGLVNADGAAVLMRLATGPGSLSPVPLGQARTELSDIPRLANYTAADLNGLTQVLYDFPEGFIGAEVYVSNLTAAVEAGLGVRFGPAGQASYTSNYITNILQTNTSNTNVGATNEPSANTFNAMGFTNYASNQLKMSVNFGISGEWNAIAHSFFHTTTTYQSLRICRRANPSNGRRLVLFNTGGGTFTGGNIQIFGRRG